MGDKPLITELTPLKMYPFPLSEEHITSLLTARKG